MPPVIDEDGEVFEMTEEEAEDEKKKAKQDLDGKVKNTDVIDLAMQEMVAKMDRENEEKHREDDLSLVKEFIDWLLARKVKEKPLWRSSRREELERYIWKWRRLVPIPFASEGFYFRRGSNRKVKYWGMMDPKKEKEGLGMCLWPDPPHGGGGYDPKARCLTESYYGLWRAGQPNQHGCFRWFDGDVYLGEWDDGSMQGYGVYAYSGRGQHPLDRYEGGYFMNMRQGSGIYFYSGKNGGIYMGEWMRGSMSGHGLIVYPGGEYYLGRWKSDKKEGKGIYVWGKSSGEVAGDKFEGNFKDGAAHGSGRTIFSDGGWHRGRYVAGKMQGFGMMQTAEGWEYVGFWREDELHGEVVCYYVYGASDSVKTVQTYNNGDLVCERVFDPEQDWTELESIGRAERNTADKEAEQALLEVKKSALFVKKAKQSQHLAREAAEEARFYVRSSLDLKDTLQAWYGLKHKIFPPDTGV